jgi:hypothetical protein
MQNQSLIEENFLSSFYSTWNTKKEEIKRLNYYFHFCSMPKAEAFTGPEFRPSSRTEGGSSMNPKSPDKSGETHEQLP